MRDNSSWASSVLPPDAWPRMRTEPELRQVVLERLTKRWSPRQIADRLEIDFADDAEMRVSPETIYQSIFVQAKGGFRKDIAVCLRSGRARRRPRSRTAKTGQIRDMVMISERPAEIEDRAIPGHWEGDLIIGKNNHSAIATLVERSTRYVLLARIPNQRAETVRNALIERVHTLPAHGRLMDWAP